MNCKLIKSLKRVMILYLIMWPLNQKKCLRLLILIMQNDERKFRANFHCRVKNGLSKHNNSEKTEKRISFILHAPGRFNLDIVKQTQ